MNASKLRWTRLWCAGMVATLAVGCTSAQAPPTQPGWESLAPLEAGPRQETGVAALGGKVYVVGGMDGEGTALDTLEVYDPASDAWSRLASLPKRLHHPNVAAVGERLFVLGALNDDFVGVGDSFVFTPATNSWSDLSPMPVGTERGASGVGIDGTRVLIAGGFRLGSMGDASSYDTATDTWTPLPSLSEPRDHLVGGVMDGTFYAVGGRRDGALRGNVDALPSGAGGWTSKAQLPTARAGCAAAIVGDRIYVFGGEGNASDVAGIFSEVESYLPETDEWTTETPMNTPRHGLGAALLDGKIHLPGGATRAGLGAVATHEAFTPSESP